MHSTATATHAVLTRLGRPHRIAPVTDAQAMSDFRAAEMLAIGIYSIREVGPEEARKAEDVVAGMRAAMQTMATPEWRAACG